MMPILNLNTWIKDKIGDSPVTGESPLLVLVNGS